MLNLNPAHSSPDWIQYEKDSNIPYKYPTFRGIPQHSDLLLLLIHPWHLENGRSFVWLSFNKLNKQVVIERERERERMWPCCIAEPFSLPPFLCNLSSFHLSLFQSLYPPLFPSLSPLIRLLHAVEREWASERLSTLRVWALPPDHMMRVEHTQRHMILQQTELLFRLRLAAKRYNALPCALPSLSRTHTHTLG